MANARPFSISMFQDLSNDTKNTQCEVFLALLLNCKHSKVPEDSKSPTFPSVGLHPHTWPKWGCDMFCYYKVKLNLNNLQMDQAIQNVQKSLIIQNIILEFETISFINSCWLIMSSNTMFQIKNKKARWHIYTNLEKKIGSNIAIVFHNASKCNCSNFKVVVYCWSKATTHDFGAKNVLIKCQIFLTNRLGNKWLQNQNEKMIYSNELEGDLKPELTWNIQDFYS
jgi:hypothetical protein